MMSGAQPSSLLPSHNVTIISTYGKHFSYSVFTPSSKNSVKSQGPSTERGKLSYNLQDRKGKYTFNKKVIGTLLNISKK